MAWPDVQDLCPYTDLPHPYPGARVPERATIDALRAPSSAHAHGEKLTRRCGVAIGVSDALCLVSRVCGSGCYEMLCPPCCQHVSPTRCVTLVKSIEARNSVVKAIYKLHESILGAHVCTFSPRLLRGSGAIAEADWSLFCFSTRALQKLQFTVSP